MQQSMAENTGATAADVFHQVDTDGSGQISFREFALWWLRRQKALTGDCDSTALQQVRATWAEHDVDHSDSLDLAEFASVLGGLAREDWREEYGRDGAIRAFVHKGSGERRLEPPDSEEVVISRASGSSSSQRKDPAAAAGASLAPRRGARRRTLRARSQSPRASSS